MFLVLLGTGGIPDAGAASPSARVVSHGSRALKTIALTFDDGASPANCRRILAELVSRNVPATFFPVADLMRLDPAFWRLVAKAGYPIGDHTLTHPHLPRLAYSGQLRELTKARAIVEQIIGRAMLHVFRPPYGEYDGATRAAAAAAGFPTLLVWDTSDRDTSPRGTVAEMLTAAEQGKNGSVMLLHCGPNATPYLLPDVIAFYRRRGFRFVTVPKLLGLAWSPGPTASLSPDEILGGLSPLPSSPAGGPILDSKGKLNPPPTVPPNLPTTTPTPFPSSTESVPPAPSSAPVTSSAATEASPNSTAGPLPGSGGAADSARSSALAVAVGLLFLALLLMAGAIRRRRHIRQKSR
ncbi:MAG: polysaccharide deacetylase family protein [Chloroflexota bacterium]|nr:polysaccharide deacetylase family protein [Chloroflexota bacterium]